MKVIQLRAENIKRLSAIEITPDGNLITIGGKNGAGKSSVLDAIAMALGGQELVPAEPIRKGEAEASVTVDLGEFIVTRKFSREQIEDVFDGSNRTTWGPTKSTLVIKNREGAKYPSPQALLDKLLGQLTFDPLAFKDAKPADQQRILKDLAGLHETLVTLEAQRQAAYDRRTGFNAQLKRQTAVLDASPFFEGAPEQEVSIQALTEEMNEADVLRREASKKEHTLERAKQTLKGTEQGVVTTKARIQELENLLTQARNQLELMEKAAKGQAEELVVLQRDLDEYRKTIPDFNMITQKMREAEETNQKVRSNEAHLNLKRQVAELKAAADKETKAIEEAIAAREKTIREAAFPVPGLGFSEHGVTFNGVPFEQASTAEQLRASVAIGLALNPKLKVLLVRNGNALDEDSMKLVADLASAADAQVWMEYVTRDAGAVSVMIEDGHVAG